MADYARIAVLENEVEARLLEAELTSRGIDFRLHSYEDLVFDGIFQGERGWGCVLAPAGAADEVAEVLALIRAGGAPTDAEK